MASTAVSQPKIPQRTHKYGLSKTQHPVEQVGSILVGALPGRIDSSGLDSGRNVVPVAGKGESDDGISGTDQRAAA